MDTTNNNSSSPCSSPTSTSSCSSLSIQNITASPSSSALLNKWLEVSNDDKLYHFGLYKSDKDLKSKFGDVKFVCIGGSPGRLCAYAELFASNMGVEKSANLSHTDRFSMWKTGSVLWINHGMGVPSLSIMLVESIKLLHYAGASNYQFIRLGTSGGIGVTPGTVVVSNGTVNGLLEEKHIQYVKGEVVKRDAVLDQTLSKNLFNAALKLGLPVCQGLTLCADDFYEGQMRLDGLFCDYSDADKHEFFKVLYQKGVKNIEMESTGFAAFTHRAGIPGAVLCVAVVNRMQDDQVVVDKDTYHEFELRPFQVVLEYIKQSMGQNGHTWTLT